MKITTTFLIAAVVSAFAPMAFSSDDLLLHMRDSACAASKDPSCMTGNLAPNSEKSRHETNEKGASPSSPSKSDRDLSELFNG